MTESFWTLIGIYFLCWFKFISGPVLGYVAGYSFWKTILVTVSGMMSSVILFTFVGNHFQKLIAIHWNRPKPKFTSKNRKIVRVWKKYGQIGIAFLTPLILTPIGGTLILVSFGTKKKSIYFHMLWSSILWAIFFSLSIESILRIPFFEKLFL